MVPSGLCRRFSRDGGEGGLRLRALHCEGRAEPEVTPDRPLTVIPDPSPARLSVSAELQGWAGPACKRCYFYSRWSVFPELFEKKKKQLKNFLTPFVLFSLRAAGGGRGWERGSQGPAVCAAPRVRCRL